MTYAHDSKRKGFRVYINPSLPPFGHDCGLLYVGIWHGRPTPQMCAQLIGIASFAPRLEGGGGGRNPKKKVQDNSVGYNPPPLREGAKGGRKQFILEERLLCLNNE